MTRAEFMQRLAELLNDVSPSEREEAIQYYNDYFDDAGTENEQGVIASLGTPEAVAKTIKAGLADGGSVGEFTEKGFQSFESENLNEVMNPQDQEEAKDSNTRGTYENYENPYGKEPVELQKPEKKTMSAGKIVLIVLVCILAFPFLVSMLGGIFGVIVGILGGLFGLVVGIGAAAIALLVVGICLFIYGITLLFSIPFGGLSMMGAAMICAAIGLFFLWLTVLICGGLVPAVVRAIANLFQKIFHRGGEKA